MQKTIYTCPMHPEIKKNTSGKCPKCFMNLEKINESNDSSHFMSNVRLSVHATAHCLTGCAIGEILGMVIATHFNWHNFLAIAVSVALAFFFGYSLTLIPLLRHAMKLKHAFSIAFATDTLSITTMEFMDNLIIVLIPGALDASLTDSLFWGSLIGSLIIAFIVTIPVNYLLIKKGIRHHH